MRSYRTEILIPADRSILLQLPAAMAEGWATVTVYCHDSATSDPLEPDPDRQDIEWWEEFDEEEMDVKASPDP